jgi:hypothetical protein
MGVTADPRYLVPTLTSLTQTFKEIGVEVGEVGSVVEAFYKAL